MVRVVLPCGAAAMIRLPGETTLSSALEQVCTKRNMDHKVHALVRPDGQLYVISSVCFTNTKCVIFCLTD